MLCGVNLLTMGPCEPLGWRKPADTTVANNKLKAILRLTMFLVGSYKK